ncbi:MAG: hypothetical protein AAF333_01785 [Planctomycetota bacterium]
MSDSPFDEETIAQLVCGELDLASDTSVRREVEADPVAAARLRRWTRAVDQLSAEAASSISNPDAFADRVAAAWDAERTSPVRTAAGRHAVRRGWLPFALGAAAAAIALMVILPIGPARDSGPGATPGGLLSPAVAWADVVAAVKQVEHFHLIAFIDDPRSADDGRKMTRADLFYQSPDRWRTHGYGHVQFIDGGRVSAYSVALQKFVPTTEAPGMVTPRFIERFNDRGLLDALLATVFDEDLPSAMPVRSADAVAQDGVEVFDYADDGGRQWARIWVLAESRLPTRIQLHYPDSDEFVLVVFDYTDPQPATFFDPEAFGRGAEALDDDDPHRVYGIGTEPISATQPRNSTQLYEVKGGYRAPTIKRVLTNDDGDVLLITNDPKNRNPRGRSVNERYLDVTDSWGNVYTSVGGFTPVGGEDVDRRWYFSPVPPIKTGIGPRTISLTYAIEQHVDGEFVNKVLAEHILDLPAPGVGEEPGDWDLEYLAESKPFRLADYLQRHAPPAQQWAIVEANLQADPQSVADLDWKVRLLRREGREAEAWAFFERRVLDTLLADPAWTDHFNATELLGQYLIRLAADGRWDDYDRARRRVLAWRDAARESLHPMIVRRIERTFTPQTYSSLGTALVVRDWQAALEADPPCVNRVVASRDGFVFLQLDLPAPPEAWTADGWIGGVPFGWFYQPHVQGTERVAWALAYRQLSPDRRSLFLIYRGTADTLQLAATAKLLADFRAGVPRENRPAVLFSWAATVERPEPTIDTMAPWFTQQGDPDGVWSTGPAVLDEIE